MSSEDTVEPSPGPLAETVKSGPRAAQGSHGSAGADERPTRYEVGEEIARGGMGRVVEATDRRLGRAVALKEALTRDRDTLERFAREIEVTARLEHPAIVPLYDAGTHPDGTPYYVMRRVNGRPLATCVAEASTLTERLALLGHVIAAAQAVAHAHKRGVLHRDLKPTNLLVGELGETVVIDWGLAKVLGDGAPDADSAGAVGVTVPLRPAQTQAGTVFGSPGFMAPEQLAGRELDARCDVYALGANLYYVLARKAPHAGGTPEDMMARAAEAPPIPIAELVPGVPRDLADIIGKALAFDPAARYPDAEALALDLERFATGQLVAARHYTRGERLGRFVRRHRIAVTVAVVALVAIAIVGTAALRRVLAANRTTRAALDRSLQEQAAAADAHAASTLTQAKLLLASDPTAAVALVRPYAESTRWREVRAIAAAARMAGACGGVTGPAKPRALMFNAAGTQLSAVDEDGSVWRIDVAARTSHVLLKLPPSESVSVTTDHAYVVSAGRLLELELASGRTRALGMTDARSVLASPDGLLLAVGSATGLRIITAATGTVVQSAERVRPVAWDASSAVIAAIGDVEAMAIAARDGTVRERRPVMGVWGLGATGTGLVVLGPREVEIAAVRRAVPALAVELGLALARDGIAVTGRRDGTVALISDHGATVLHAPAGGITALAAAPRGRYVAAAAHGRVHLWDLDALTPHRYALAQAYDSLGPAGDTALLLGSHTGRWQFHDPAGRATQAFEVTPGLYAGLASMQGDVAVLRGDPRLDRPLSYLVMRWDPQPIRLLAPALQLPEPSGLIAGSDIGEVTQVRVRDFDQLDMERVANRPVAVTSLAVADHWRAARWADGWVWRQRDGEASQLAFLGADPGATITVRSDGAVCGAVGAALTCWGRDGIVRTLTTLAEPPRGWIELVDHGLASLRDGVIMRVDLATGEVVEVPVRGTLASIGPRQSLAVITTGDGAVHVYDAIANVTWPLAPALAGGSIPVAFQGGSPAHVYGLFAGTNLLEWTVAVPESRDDMPRWLDELLR